MGMLTIFVYTHIRYQRQAQTNSTLMQQQARYVSVVAEQRAYRHNLMNMLYGLDGQMLSGYMNQLRAYYDELVHKTRLINNENIVSLQQIHSDAVRSLLLRQMEKAQDQQLPFLLFAENLTKWMKIDESDCCTLLGILESHEAYCVLLKRCRLMQTMKSITNGISAVPVSKDDPRILAQEFYQNHYDKIVVCCLEPGSSITYLGDSGSRTCRFCKHTEPLVSFNMIAHAIPESCGNKTLFSHYECDACNTHFG